MAVLVTMLSLIQLAHPASPPSTEVKPGPWTETETLVWSMLQATGRADLGTICPGEAPSPEDEEDKRWDCRKITADFLRDVLTRAPWRETVPPAGVHVIGARIVGKLDLVNVRLVRELWIEKALFDSDILLDGARTENSILLERSVVTGDFSAGNMNIGGGLYLRPGTRFNHLVDLSGAKIDGQVALTAASVKYALVAEGLHVGHDLRLRSDEDGTACFKDVDLRDARIEGQVDLSGAIIGQITLRGAKIGGQFDLTGTTIYGTLAADGLTVDADLIMRSDENHVASFADVQLRRAKIGGLLDLTGANVGGTLYGDFLHVGESLFMRSEKDHSATFEHVTLPAAKIGVSLDLRGATLGELDLSQSVVTGILRLGIRNGKQTKWHYSNGLPGTLNLRNTEIGTLSEEMNAWPDPDRLKLEGLSFAHLGGPEGETEAKIRKRGIGWWDEWARRDLDYSPTPYVQLAAAFLAAGDRDAANDIRFLGREREREERWENGDRVGWWLQTIVSKIAGYGIGTYTFYVLRPVLILTLIGTYILRLTVPDRRRQYHGALWCFGASLSRILPVVEINKEFTEFFNDPKRDRLYAWQSFTFSALGVLGWILGGILIAALAGLTQNP